MREAPRLTGYDETPMYTMKTVVQQTGITPTTLRAWERRYGILQPDRSDGGYRLYSEHDIALLRWLKSQVEDGINIGRAVALLELRLQDSGRPSAPPDLRTAPVRFKASPEPEVATSRTEIRNAGAMSEELLKVLLHFCESRAGTILSEAFALYPMDTVVEQVIVPVLVSVGERWEQGSVSAVQANFASSFLRQRITAMLAAYSQPSAGPLAVTGCGPGEWHEIGILLVSMALRRQGWRVLYLGQNVPADELITELSTLGPELLCLSATTSEAAYRSLPIVRAIAKSSESRPQLLLGGQAFYRHSDLLADVPAAQIGRTASEAVASLSVAS